MNMTLRAAALTLLVLAGCRDAPAQPEASPAPTEVASAPIAELDPPPATSRVLLRVPRSSIVMPAPKDTRTQAQIVVAACTSPSGEWRCSGKKPATFMASGASTPIIPASWTVPKWIVDPANASGTASDSNDCVTTSTACLTWQEINVHRWGCLGNPVLCPRLQQNTTITFTSSQPGSTDPVALYPALESNAWIAVTGSLGAAQQVCTGNLSAVTNFVVGTNTLTKVTLPCAAAVNDLVVDSTNPSGFWTYEVNGAAPAYFTSTPLSSAASYTLGTALGFGTEVTIGADAVTVYSPVSINLVAFSPTMLGSISTAVSSVSNLRISGGTLNRDASTVGGTGQGLVYTNVQSSRLVTVERYWTRTFQVWLNNDFSGAMTNYALTPGSGITLDTEPIGIIGGIVGVGSGGFNVIADYTFFDGDVIFGNMGGTAFQYALYSPSMGAVFIDSNVTVNADWKANLTLPRIPGSVRLWGTGTYNTVGKTIYPTGAGAAAAAFGAGGVTIKENNLTVGCIGNPAAAGGITACNSAVTASNLDTVLGTTIPNGCIFNPGGGGAYCNSGAVAP
jgi:hypothetical protein